MNVPQDSAIRYNSLTGRWDFECPFCNSLCTEPTEEQARASLALLLESDKSLC